MRRSIMFKRVFVLLIVLGLAANASAALVAYYDFEEGSGTVLDQTANNNDGTLTNGAVQSTGAAKVGSYGLDFRDEVTGGASHGVDLGSIQDPCVFGGDDAFGLSMWMNWSGQIESWWEGKWYNRGQRIVGLGTGWTNTKYTFHNLGGSTEDNLSVRRGGPNVFANFDYNMPTDTWVFVEVRYDPGTGMAGLRVDGGAWDDKAYTPGPDTYQVRLGGAFDTGYSFYGMIDEVKFYNHAIPEPATIALLGLGGLLLRRRRR
jgi:hypothetical protein